MTRIVVEHRVRFCRFGSEYVRAALAAQGRELVADMTEILTSMCAQLYGQRVAENRAVRAVAAAATEDAEAA